MSKYRYKVEITGTSFNFNEPRSYPGRTGTVIRGRKLLGGFQ